MTSTTLFAIILFNTDTNRKALNINFKTVVHILVLLVLTLVNNELLSKGNNIN